MTDSRNSPLAEVDPVIAGAIDNEVARQANGLELIASENFVSEAVLEAAGSVFTNKYAEGYPGKRYYGGSKETEQIDYDELQKIAEEHRPKLLVCGASAYPRIIDFERIGQIARSVGARMFADIAHIAGPVAAGLHPSPIPHADYVTTT